MGWVGILWKADSWDFSRDASEQSLSVSIYYIIWMEEAGYSGKH